MFSNKNGRRFNSELSKAKGYDEYKHICTYIYIHLHIHNQSAVDSISLT